MLKRMGMGMGMGRGDMRNRTGKVTTRVEMVASGTGSLRWRYRCEPELEPEHLKTSAAKDGMVLSIVPVGHTAHIKTKRHLPATPWRSRLQLNADGVSIDFKPMVLATA